MCTALLSKVSLKVYNIKFVIRIGSARNIGGGGGGIQGLDCVITHSGSS